MPTTPQKPDDPVARALAKRKAEMAGTHILPMPDKAPIVAGMPRKGRSLADPGDPGSISPADDVYANDPADLSQVR
jgi:hypothetical protein